MFPGPKLFAITKVGENIIFQWCQNSNKKSSMFYLQYNSDF